jgi:filamin/ABP280 repeat protein/Big-like domain-containing protein
LLSITSAGPMPLNFMRRLLAPLALLSAVGCGGGDLVLPNQGQPALVTMVRGDAQTGTILAAPPESLVVLVTDRFNNPLNGIQVTWTPDGGGSVNPPTSLTGPNGQASTNRILGGEPGTYHTIATAADLPDGGVTFTTTAVAASLSLETQPSAAGESGVPLEQQPVVRLVDLGGNPLARPDVAVTVQIASGQGTLSGTTTRSSDAEGRVTFTDLAIVGGPGARTLIFAAEGYASAISSPIGLGIGPAASIAVVGGDQQTAPAGTAVPVAPTVIVRDAAGTPVPGVAIRFTVTAGGGSVSGGETTTGAEGTAAAGAWTLGASPGSNTLRAETDASGVSGNPVTFTATAVAGSVSPTRSRLELAPRTIAASTGSDVSTVTVTALDGAGNPLAGLPVTLAATGDGVTLVQPSSPTDASGVTTGTISASVAGDHVVSATVGGTALSVTATLSVTAGPPVPANSSADVPNGVAGTPTVMTVRLVDALGNPVTGARDRVDVRVSGANNTGRLGLTDNGDGTYQVSYTPTVAGSDLVQILLDGAALPGSPFTSVVVPGASDPAHTTAAVPKDATFLSPVGIVVHVADAEGNPVGHGGDQVQITVRNIGSLSVTDHGDGSYSASFFPPGPTTFTIDISLNGVAISGSPFSVRVRLFR